MKPASKRNERVTEMIQRKLSALIQQGVKGKNLPSFITISAVRMSPDLEHAKVLFTVFDKDPKETAKELNNAAGYFRSRLAKIMTSRTVPQLHFLHDETIEYAINLTKLINDANTDDKEE